MNRTLAVVLMAILLGAGSANAAIINLDGIANSSVDGSNGVVVPLAPGVYDIAPAIAAYTAFNRNGTVTGCDGSGANCATGWEWGFEVSLDQLVIPAPGFDCCGTGVYFATPGLAFANAPALGQFTVVVPTNMTLWIPDDINFQDNLGGISLSLTSSAAIPEPSTWAMIILGFAALGAALRNRRRAPVFA